MSSQATLPATTANVSGERFMSSQATLPATTANVAVEAAATDAAAAANLAAAAAATSMTTFSAHSLEYFRSSMETFVDERDWHKFHTPRNILLAMVGEVGELAELFQWKGEVGVRLPGWSTRDREHLGEEMSDVLLYLVRLADKCGVDLPAAAVRKMSLNAKKYPAEKVMGRSDKYTAYEASEGTKIALVQSAPAAAASNVSVSALTLQQSSAAALPPTQHVVTESPAQFSLSMALTGVAIGAAGGAVLFFAALFGAARFRRAL